MELEELDRKVEFAERRVMVLQNRIIEENNKASILLKKLEREAEGLEQIKKEWIRKRNTEEERVKIEEKDMKVAHRHSIEDMRLRYGQERENKFRDIRVMIKEEENQLERLRIKLTEESAKTRAGEALIKANYQEKLKILLKEEQSASRRGVVRQKRLLGDTPNIFSMSIEKNHPVGMKKRTQPRRMI